MVRSQHQRADVYHIKLAIDSELLFICTTLLGGGSEETGQ
jgi:hypothetical protein